MFLKKILCIIFLLSGCSIIEDEGANNNTPIKALSSKIFNAPVTIQGNFSSLQDKDYYPIYIEKSGYYSIAVTPAKGFDIKLSLLNNDTKTIIIADDYYKNFGEQIPSIFLKQQLYYILIEHKKESYVSSGENKNPNYSLMIQPFSLETAEKTFSLEKGNNTHIEALQTLYPKVKHFGFFQPTNDNNLQDNRLEYIVNYIEKTIHKEYKPYKLSLYTFSIDKSGDFLINLSLTGVKDVDSALAIFDLATFQSIIDKKFIAPQKLYSIIQDKNSYDQEESIQNYNILGGKRYILVLIGSNRLNYKSFLEGQKNYYELLWNIKSLKNIH